jgi:nitrogen PTS system EIIA component
MGTFIKLSELIDESSVLDLGAIDKNGALNQLCKRLATKDKVLDGDAFYRAVIEREKLASTGVGLGIAIPHVKIPEVTDYVMVVGRSRAGIPFDSIDGEPVHLIFLVGASDRQTREFVKILAQMTNLLKTTQVREALFNAPTPADFLRIVRENEK